MVKQNLEYSLFLGCTSPVRAQNYELSTRKVANALGIKLIDLDFLCCGYPIEAVDKKLALLMASRNLALSEKNGLNIATICSACAMSLTKANKLLNSNKEILEKINEQLKTLGLSYSGKIFVKHFIRILFEDFGVNKIKEKVKNPLNGLRFIAYYGCHYSRPSKVYNNFDEAENPHSLDELIEITGAKSIEFNEKNECCGSPLLLIDENIALTIAYEKLIKMKKIDADAIVVICPFCGLMYDLFQVEVEKRFNERIGILVLYYPQLLGLALGISPNELGIHLNRIEVKGLIEKLKFQEGF
jgi:heterodisulfide reductase subunit B